MMMSLLLAPKEGYRAFYRWLMPGYSRMSSRLPERTH